MNTSPSKDPCRIKRGWIVVLALAAIGNSHAAGRFELKSTTVDGGGNYSQGARFAIEGTVGQHDAAPRSQGIRFSVSGGFWPTATAPTSAGNGIFSNGFEG
jgi:hypothetical protein